MTDDEVGPGEHRDFAIELKRLFESITAEADEMNEEIFFEPELEHALRRMIVDPRQPSLDHLLDVSPILIDSVGELRALLNIVGNCKTIKGN